MTELTKQAKRLRAQIEAAFADVPYPGDDHLYEGGQRDDDYDDVIRNLTGKHWRDFIPKRKPRKDRSSQLNKDLYFCSPAAWHFFLPAHLIAEVMRGKVDPLPFHPARSERLKDHTEDRFSRLNAAQCAAVAAFLAHADALLVEEAGKIPKHCAYFERKQQELAPVVAYWHDRARGDKSLSLGERPPGEACR